MGTNEAEPERTSEEFIPKKESRRHKKWMTLEILQPMNEMRKNKNNPEKYKDLNGKVKDLYNEAKDLWITCECVGIQVKHSEFFGILDQLKIDGKDIRILKNLYREQVAAIRIDGEYTDVTEIKRDVRQGCVLSPDLLNLYSEVILRNITDMEGVRIGGHGSNMWPEVIQGPIDSIYMRMRKRNRCNHRDYQNIAFNGAKSFDAADVLVKSLSRDKTDRPLLLAYAFFGNDVCNKYPDTFDHMTTPAQMFNNTMRVMEHLVRL
ncbi:acyloxyacyl hydrolase [Elysia marginata]|uniref:Acyloxyacyl hydrolase n=1 Tax=Elysia marginata TaxID=1093978 RepID=A0AAV4F9Q7_9GAST|nr:acyloxyacyl hydrolase [Elysia marginata]